MFPHGHNTPDDTIPQIRFLLSQNNRKEQSEGIPYRASYLQPVRASEKILSDQSFELNLVQLLIAYTSDYFDTAHSRLEQ